MSSRNYSAWQQAIRDSHRNGVLNPLYQSAWGNPGVFRLPFGPGRIYVVSWPHYYRHAGLKLVLHETYDETRTESVNYVDPLLTDSSGTLHWSRLVDVDMQIPKAWVFFMTTPEEFDETNMPERYAHRIHSSATPYGEGLYDAEGMIRIVAPTRFEDHFTNSALPILNTDDLYFLDTEFRFHYRSDCSLIIGRNTPARVSIAQFVHGPANAYKQDVTMNTDNPGTPVDDVTLADIPYNPQELDPDGVPGADVEQYVEETALRALNLGEITMEMVRLANGTGRTVGPYDDGPDSSQVTWSQSWARSGELSLTLSP